MKKILINLSANEVEMIGIGLLALLIATGALR